MIVQPFDIEHHKLQSNHRRADERLKKASIALDAADTAKRKNGTKRENAALRHADKAHRKAAMSEAKHSAALLEYVIPTANAGPTVKKRL